MTLLAGVWRFGGPRDGNVACDADASTRTLAAMIDAQRAGVAAHPLITVSGGVALAQADLGAAAQVPPVPPAAPSAPVLVADARIDNRAELLAQLGLRESTPVDDSALVALAQQRWGADLVDHLLGDFAIAWWDAGQEALVLVRDPTGQRPLYYHVGDGFVVVASMPQGLFALDGVRPAINSEALTRFVADVPSDGAGSFFRDVARVPPAHVVRITRGGVSARRYWSMPAREVRYARDDDYVQAFREQLDRATVARLRDAGPIVAAHLSGGIDSLSLIHI